MCQRNQGSRSVSKSQAQRQSGLGPALIIRVTVGLKIYRHPLTSLHMDLENMLSPVNSQQSAQAAIEHTDDYQRVPTGRTFLARGAAADVWLASSPDIHGRKYIIKTIRVNLGILQENCNPRGPRRAKELWANFIGDFRSRVQQWEVLQHDNIITLFGIHEDLNLLVEFCANGTASQYLEGHSNDHIISRKHMMLDILAGMEYLHSREPPVIHGCICMDKLLVDSQGRTPVAEFGLAGLAEEFGLFAPSISQSNRTRWLCPELLDIGPDDQPPTCTMASDVWALGCTLFEIISGKLPYSKLKHNLRVQQAILSKKPPGQQESCLTPDFVPFWPLLEHCWSWVPEQRPGADSINRSMVRLMQHSEMRPTPPLPTEQVQPSTPWITTLVSGDHTVSMIMYPYDPFNPHSLFAVAIACEYNPALV
ncbi:hypothetical protein RSAG8_13379, partial [Rhizoctonia solani AG-8 WAC10335]